MEQSPEPDPAIRIIRFDGQELSLEEAQSGTYVFAAGPVIQTVYAFPREEAEPQVESWAAAQGLAGKLEQAREVIERLPEDPGAEVDEEAERAEVEEINRRLETLSAETGLAFGTPELLKLAEDKHIFDSAILYSQPLYRKPHSVGLRNSCTDLSRYFAGGALSCETIGYDAVYLYEQPNYGPNKYVPAVRLIGCDRIAQTPCGILSALFV
jgi:hypothetical protein